MKNIRYGERTWMAGDAITETLMDYAAALGRSESAEHVRIAVIDAAGETVELDLLIGPATMMSAEPAFTDLREPNNDEVERGLRARAAALSDST